MRLGAGSFCLAWATASNSGSPCLTSSESNTLFAPSPDVSFSSSGWSSSSCESTRKFSTRFLRRYFSRSSSSASLTWRGVTVSSNPSKRIWLSFFFVCLGAAGAGCGRSCCGCETGFVSSGTVCAGGMTLVCSVASRGADCFGKLKCFVLSGCASARAPAPSSPMGESPAFASKALMSSRLGASGSMPKSEVLSMFSILYPHFIIRADARSHTLKCPRPQRR